MTEWLSWLREHAMRAPAAMVSVLACEGSAPRGPGTRMVVTPDLALGTIGGGALEHRAIQQARAVLDHPPGTWRVQDYPLGPLLGQCCGGRVRLLVEHVDPAGLGWVTDATTDSRLISTLTDSGIERWISADAAPSDLSARGERPGPGSTLVEVIGKRLRPLLLFGAGHVGQAIARHATGLPFQLGWFDTRPEFAPVDGVTLAEEAELPAQISEAPDDAALLILTHDHALDYRLTQAALSRPPVAFVGLIGSATKRARFLGRLAKDGLPDTALARLTCPIGLPGIPGKEPDVIAIATLAQLLGLGRA